ncbi:hypothetical protein IW261DRAFT_133127 [Armillaria novae-zelandiae]|uniref:Uncharacterized protein n=1 Tax=Armillaria novae-zelandiae TaxID=153914 RepID=A0AA39NEI8_9AGAR|nr:hypothetical protein IW261DRAFT_133127 [Armillaria novae-zelandiae]
MWESILVSRSLQGHSKGPRMMPWTTSTTLDPPQAPRSSRKTTARTPCERRHLSTTQTPDCGVYCSGTTRRHGEDRFYCPRVHRFLAGASILFDLANFGDDDDHGIVQALRVAAAVSTPAESTTVVLWTIDKAVVCSQMQSAFSGTDTSESKQAVVLAGHSTQLCRFNDGR